MERTKQTGLNELVEQRIKQKLSAGMLNVEKATTRLQAEGKISKDFIFEVGTERKGTSTNIDFFPDGQRVGATFHFPKNNPDPEMRGPKQFNINMHGIRQVAAKLSIPSTYITTLLMGEEWQKTLGYQILNAHNGWTNRDKVLIRSVGTEVRAFLSDQYRRLDSEMIFATHIDEIYKNGGQLSDGYMDDTRVMVESLLSKPIEIHTELNGIVLVAFGTKMITSDYGDGALELKSFVMQGVCLNGMVRESIRRIVHLGGKLPGDISFSEETYKLDSLTTASAIRDLTKKLYSSETVKNRMLEIKTASSTPAEPENVLRNLFLTGKLLKGESEDIGRLLMRNSARDGIQGEASIWKIMQGITRYANNVDVAERRRMELQEIAGDMVKKLGFEN